MSPPRLPDFVVIGAGKSGTTTLYRWLCEQPEVFPLALKEPRFFSRDWHKGLEWYAELFAPCPEDQLVGEASTNYTDVQYSDLAAARMAQVIPDARLVYLLRHPVERLRSQYRHDWRRAAESAPLEAAVQRAGNPYVGRSLYHRRLQPYIERFSRDQICVVRFEDLVSTEGPAWADVLSHLGLSGRPSPTDAHNVTADRPQVSPLVRRLDRAGWPARLGAVAPPVRRWGQRILQRAPTRPPADSAGDIPGPVLDDLYRDLTRLESWLGVEQLWERTD